MKFSLGTCIIPRWMVVIDLLTLNFLTLTLTMNECHKCEPSSLILIIQDERSSLFLINGHHSSCWLFIALTPFESWTHKSDEHPFCLSLEIGHEWILLLGECLFITLFDFFKISRAWMSRGTICKQLDEHVDFGLVTVVCLGLAVAHLTIFTLFKLCLFYNFLTHSLDMLVILI